MNNLDCTCYGDSEDCEVCDPCLAAVQADAVMEMEMNADRLLERQELEDFEQVDEYFGSCNDAGEW